MNPTNQTTVSNPDNLPVIEENSLHRIVTTVKLYQEFKELGQEKFEEIYGKADPKSLEGVCYKKYYEGKSEGERFGLIKNSPLEGWQAKPDGVDLELGDYLEVDLDEDKNVTKIKNLKEFIWKEWDITENKNIYNEKIKIDLEFNFEIVFRKIKILNTLNSNLLDETGWSKSRKVIFKSNVIFNSCKFTTLSFSNCSFLDGLSLNFSIITGNFVIYNGTFNSHSLLGLEILNSFICYWTKFNSVVFWESIRIEHRAIFEDVDFNGYLNLNYKAKLKNVKFYNCNFNDEVYGDRTVNNGTIFEDVIFTKCNFKKEVSFKKSEIYKNLSFKNCTFSKKLVLVINNNIKDSEIGFENSTIEDNFYLNLKNDVLYKNITLNLYNFTCSNLFCDSRNINQIKLSKTEELKTKKDKKITEQAIQERRVFRKILQDLHWGDYADEEYAKIMDLQLGLKKPIPRFFERLFFSWWLGWGVRILTWKFWQGGIIWSSILLAILGWLALSTKSWLDSKIVLAEGSSFLRSLNLIFTSDATSFTEILFVILGFIQLNLFLVILARKFMRM